MHICVWVVGDGVGWGMLTFHEDYTLSMLLLHLHTYVMLLYAVGSSLALAHIRHAFALAHIRRPFALAHIRRLFAFAHIRHATLWDLLLHLHYAYLCLGGGGWGGVGHVNVP